MRGVYDPAARRAAARGTVGRRHDRLEPTVKTGPVDHHPPEPELSFRARLEPDGSGAEVSARARSRIGGVAASCVLIVFFIVAGVVLVARTGGAQREDPRRLGPARCTERIERIDRTCERDGS
jgi:hypothetical protein